MKTIKDERKHIFCWWPRIHGQCTEENNNIATLVYIEYLNNIFTMYQLSIKITSVIELSSTRHPDLSILKSFQKNGNNAFLLLCVLQAARRVFLVLLRVNGGIIFNCVVAANILCLYGTMFMFVRGSFA